MPQQKKPGIRQIFLFVAFAAVAPVRAVETKIAEADNQVSTPQYTLMNRGHVLGRFEDLTILQPRDDEQAVGLLILGSVMEPELADWLRPEQATLQAVISEDWLRWKRGDAADWQGIAFDQLADCDGGFFRPEIDDEVLVVFTSGDMRMPVIIGALYNGKDAPPQIEQGEDGTKEKQQTDEVEVVAKLEFQSDQELKKSADCPPTK